MIPATKTTEKTAETALLSIGFLMDMTDRVYWECGGGRGPWEACMATLVLALEPGCKARRLLEAMPAEKNMDGVALLNAMANLGYVADGTEIALQDVEPRLLPCLFVPQGRENAPIVILSSTDEGLTIYDSQKHAVHTGSRDKMRGKAFFFQPFDRNAQASSKFLRGASGNWFGAVVRRFAGSFWQILITCLALNIFALAPSLFIMAAYDRVISPADSSALPALTAGVALALLAEWALRDVRSEGLAWMTARLDNVVGSEIFARLIGLPAAMIEQASVAAQVARIRTFEAVRDFFSNAVFLSFLEIPFVLIAVGVMAVIAGPLVTVPLLVIGAYTALFFFMRHKIKGAMRMAAKASSARQQFMIETFEKIRSIRMNGLTPAWEKKFSNLSGREIVLNFQLGFLGSVAETLANALTIISAVATIGYGAQLIWAGTITTGALVASMILVWRILLPFYSLCTMIPRLEQLRNSIIQVNSLMELDTEAETAATAAALATIKGHVELDAATLRYGEEGDPVIDGLTLDIPAGKIAAITGRNGSGKTSVLKLVKGLYRPQTGMVRIDGFDIRQMDATELRRQVAYVPQTPDFFPGTLAENLVIGNPFATAEDIEKALKRAAAWDEIGSRLSTPIEDISMTTTLAARISLARAYLQNARVLLIDELPNAVMNGPAGRNLKEFLAQSKEKHTAILVTHRGDLMDMSDIIVRLARGEKPLVGARDIVMKKMKEAA